jgi:membrane-bound ClpP family serine protease
MSLILILLCAPLLLGIILFAVAQFGSHSADGLGGFFLIMIGLTLAGSSFAGLLVYYFVQGTDFRFLPLLIPVLSCLVAGLYFKSTLIQRETDSQENTKSL